MPARSWVVTTPTRTRRPVTVSRTAAWDVARSAGPIRSSGYQSSLNTFVSPGAMNEKSGWLSANTPAISSTYAESSSARLRPQARPKAESPHVHIFLPTAS